jgi:hypothetical protein
MSVDGHTYKKTDSINDQVVILIENLSETVELPFFFSCMWLVMISNPSLRPPALNYLLRKLPKITDREGTCYMCSLVYKWLIVLDLLAVAVVLGGKENVSLMVRAFASTLNDHQLLVQRGMLELLVQNFMLKSRMIPHEDLVILMRAALGIVLRKDMSLNRRLYAWVLGSDGTTQAQVLYFNMYAEKPATQAVRGMLQQQQQQLISSSPESTDIEQQRPYKILISLMDKWELGQPIVNNIFVDSLISLRSIKSQQAEIIKTANMWMDMVEPYLICLKLFELIDVPFSTNKKTVNRSLDHMQLMEYTLETFHLIDDEIKHIHFPLILASLTRKLKDALKSPAFIEILPQVSQCITLILNILQKLPESVFLNRPNDNENINEHKHFQSGGNIIEYARDFYGLGQSPYSPQLTDDENKVDHDLENESNEEGGDLSSSANIKKPSQAQSLQFQVRPEYEPLRGSLLIKEVADNLTGFLIDFINSYIVLPENLQSGVDVGVEGKRLKHIEHHLEHVFLNACTAITMISKHADHEFVLERSEQLTHVLLKCCQQVKVFGVVDAGLSTLTLLASTKQFVDPMVLKHTTHIKAIVDKLWGFLTPTMQLLHMRTVELLWLLIDASLPHQIETIVSNYLIHQDDERERLSSYEKFGIVWELSENIPDASSVFSRPMFLMLDLLREGTSPLDRRAGETWIRCHLKSYVRLLEPFMTALLDKHIVRRPAELQVDWKNQTLKKKEDKYTDISYFIYMRAFDTDIIDYMFTTLVTLITFGGLNVLKTCKNHTVDGEGVIGKLAQASLDYNMSRPATFLDLLVSISIR